jgi:serine/threonine-protein kinase HipA
VKFSALHILVGDTLVGVLFKYGAMIRLQIDPAYANNPRRSVLSLSMRAANPAQDAALLLNPLTPMFNSPGNERLPPFFQNLLPEGLLRTHIAAERGCEENDYFELLAACGNDLPGNVRALPARLSRDLTARLVTQNQDALEQSVVEDPLDDGVSISGLQPKLALIREGGRFVAGRRHGSGHVIGKLPTTQYDLLPEVEHLSLALARAAGADVCEATLEPMSLIMADHAYALGKSDCFLAVRRFDRDRPGRLHVEDFAQILAQDPDSKYTGGSYADIARVMLRVDGLGEPAVLELVRRLAVNELLGNFDFHLKNIGVLHFPDGAVRLSPAYDIVAYGACMEGRGHALPFARGERKRQTLGPAALRSFANDTGMGEPPLRKIIAEVCRRALDLWPGMIATSDLLPEQKRRLRNFVEGRPMIAGLMRRRSRSAPPTPV